MQHKVNGNVKGGLFIVIAMHLFEDQHDESKRAKIYGRCSIR